MKRYFAIAALAILSACSNSNVPDIKAHAAVALKAMGFNLVGYEGYEYTGAGRWGGCVWYTMERNGVTYDGCLSKWGNEYHLYNLRAYDAVAGSPQ